MREFSKLTSSCNLKGKTLSLGFFVDQVRGAGLNYLIVSGLLLFLFFMKEVKETLCCR